MQGFYSTEKKRKVEEQKTLIMLLFIICEAPQNNFIIFWPIFDHFYPISPAIFVLEQKFGIDDLRDPPSLDQLGKERKKSV